MDGEILEVLKEIRDEAKQTNVRLASLEGRVEFLEKRTTKSFESLNASLDSHVERLEVLTRQQAESEIRLATEVLSLADVTRDVRDLLSRKLDDHHMVLKHEEQIKSLEIRVGDRGEK